MLCYNITPEQLEFKHVVFKDDFTLQEVPKQNGCEDVDLKSPAGKRTKFSSTPVKTPVKEHRDILSKDTHSKKSLDFNGFMLESPEKMTQSTQTDLSFIKDDVESQTLLDEMILKIPAVCEFFCEHDQLHRTRFIQHLQLLEYKEFPMENICYLVFLILIENLSLDDTGRMEYSPATKRFWYVGYKLFHYKLISFFKGETSDKNDDDNQVDKSQINFAIPDQHLHQLSHR